MPAKRASRNKLNKDDEKNGGGGRGKKRGKRKENGREMDKLSAREGDTAKGRERRGGFLRIHGSFAIKKWGWRRTRRRRQQKNMASNICPAIRRRGRREKLFESN